MKKMSYTIAKESAMEHDRIRLTVDGCPISLTCYRVGATFFCKADNIPPDVWTTHAAGATRDEAQRIVLEQARRLVVKSRTARKPAVERAPRSQARVY
jgi:hypothetical protein